MPVKILIVDDDVDTLRLVGLMLQRQGYEIVAANNGNQALTLADSENPDLVLLDVMMPDMDGYEVTRRLRANPATSDIPIIMFTAKSQVDDKVTGFEVGADDYLTKPTQPRELFAHVKAVLARGSKAKPSQPEFSGEKGLVTGLMAAKGGLGISTLSLNLGIILRNKTRKDVIVAELRPGEGSIGMDLGFTRPEGLNRLLQKKPTEISATDIENELVSHSSGIRLLLSSYQPRDARFRNSLEGYETITRNLAYMCDHLLIDLGPSLPPTTEKVLDICEQLIVALEPIPYTVIRTKALLDDLVEKGFGEGRVKVVLVNRIRTEMQLSWTQVQEKLGQSLAVAFTPAPELTYQAAKNKVPVVLQQPDSLITQQFTKLAETLLKQARQTV
jgi:CheY-like chemotaxis protein